MSTSSHPERLQIWLDRHARAVDVLLALAVFSVNLPGQVNRTTVLFSAALALPLVWRRRWPLPVFAATAAVAFVGWLADEPLVAHVGLLVALYTVAAYRSVGATIAALAVLELGIALATVRWASGSELQILVFLNGMAIVATVLGVHSRTRRAYLTSVEERAAQLERERDQQGRLAAAAERARIARELHDVVAHNLSVMIALADGASFATRADPERAAAAMEQVSATGRQALTEMRRLVGVLREADADAALAPQPGIPQLDALIEQVRSTGLPVTVETAGEPVPLGAGAELTVYRLVQEALTNTLKHAGPGAHAIVRLRYDGDGIEIEVTDDGLGAGPAANGGQGLTGMRERAAVYGGAVEAGPGDAGGWRVHTRLGLAG